MKYLFVGDLHTKYGFFEIAKKLSENYDKVIFLGDYVDDWNTISYASLNLLTALIDFKLKNPDKVELLLGNHDLSEWIGKPFICSGYNMNTSTLVAPLYEKYEHLFNITYVIDDMQIICSHAGLTKSWLAKYGLNSEYPKSHKELKKLSDSINKAFHNRQKLDSREIFYGLADVGYARGGHRGNKEPSPIWADSEELISDWYPVVQIVGHTPHRTVTFYNQEGKEIYFCDTFSTYMDGTNYGDWTLLTLDGTNFTKISIDGEELSW